MVIPFGVLVSLLITTQAWAIVRPGDLAFQERGNPERADEALTTYRSTYQKNPEDPEAGWRLSMACYFVGLRLIKDEDEKKKLFLEGRAAGQSSLKANPSCAPCHFWTAINMALYGDTVGPFKTLALLGEVKDHLKDSLMIDPKYAYGGAYRLLGLIEQKLPGILGGSNRRAKEYFEKAIATAPDEPLNYLFLSQLFRKDLDQPEEATRVAKAGLALPVPSADRLESKEALLSLRQELGEAD